MQTIDSTGLKQVECALAVHSEHPLELLEQALPLALHKASDSQMELTLVARSRPGLCKFFYEMTSRWLVPGKRVNISRLFSLDFEYCDESLNLTQMTIDLHDQVTRDVATSHLALLENELLIGATSLYHATKIIELKGLGLDEKTALVQERLSHYLYRMPQKVDHDVFAMMQHVFMVGREPFRMPRDVRHLARIIAVLYLFYNDLRLLAEQEPTKRSLFLKFIRPTLSLPFGSQNVLGIFVGLNFIKEHEVFEKRHLFEAVSTYISGIQVVEDSYIFRKSKEGTHAVLYLEVEKEQGYDFTRHELKVLRRMLPHRLKTSVQHLIRPIFMPRNEEEVMKHIVTLSKQVKLVRDLPQVVITFDQQTDNDLTFTVVLVRPILPTSQEIEKLTRQNQGDYLISLERVKKVGLLRNKYPKEAAVFRVSIPAKPFIRHDHSVDMIRARSYVSKVLQKRFGEYRDFNGGMISKQVEKLHDVKELLGEMTSDQSLMLENLFHSLNPREMAAVWSSTDLARLYTLLDSCLKKSFDNTLQKSVEYRDGSRVYSVVGSKDPGAFSELLSQLKGQKLSNADLIHFRQKFPDGDYFGYILAGSKEVALH